MARILLQLKVALLRDRALALRDDRSAVTRLVVTGAMVAWFASQLGPSFVENLAETGTMPDAEDLAAMQSFSLVFSWIAMPLAFTGRRDLDVRRFQLLPVRPAALTRGLAATWLLSPWIWSTVAVVAVIASSFPDATSHAVPLAVSGASVVALCALCGRVVVTGSDLLARGRRARDLLIVSSIVVSAVPVLLLFELMSRFDDPTSSSAVGDAIAWLPPSWPGRGLAAAGQGDLGLAIGCSAATFAVVALLWWAWTAIVARSLLAEDASTERTRTRDDPFDGFGARMPRGRRGAVAALELRLLWREPARLPNTILVTILFGGMMTLVAAAAFAGNDTTMAGLGALAVTFSIPSRRMNEVGIHSSAMWTNVVAAGKASDDVVGRDIANALIDVPLVVLTVLVLTAITGGWAVAPAALAVSLAGIAAVYAAMHVVSVRLAQGTPRSMDADAPSQGGQSPVQSVVAIVAYALATAALFALCALPAAAGAAWFAVTVPLALCYGAALWWGSVRWIGGWLDAHQADLLNRIDR